MKHQPTLPNSFAQQGAAAVEFAIVLPLLLLVLTGIVEYGRLMWNYDALAKATRDAARYLSLEKPINATAKSTARTMADNAAAASGIGDLLPNETDVQISCSPADCNAPNTVTVRINYDFTIGGWVPVFGTAVGPEITLSPHTTMPYMR